MDRRQFGKLAVMGGTAAMLPGFASAQTGVDADGMRNLAANAKPISAEERRAGVACRDTSLPKMLPRNVR